MFSFLQNNKLNDASIRVGLDENLFEPPHDETNKVAVRPANTQISLGIRPVWSETSLSTWRKLGSLATHSVHSNNSDQTGRMPRLIWVFTGHSQFVGFVMRRLIFDLLLSLFIEKKVKA